MYDKCLAMGCASSCKIFETFSTALERVAKCKLGCNHVIHILDDFLFVASSFPECKQALDRFLQCCERIGVPIAHEKTMGPSQCLIFAGIELDTNDLEAHLPEDKLTKCKHAVRGMLDRKSVTLRELQRIIGQLNFACMVVVPGRAFLRRLINLTSCVSSFHLHVRLDRSAKADFEGLGHFLEGFNGKALMLPDTWVASNCIQLVTDAAASLGYGRFWGRNGFMGPGQRRGVGRTLHSSSFIR